MSNTESLTSADHDIGQTDKWWEKDGIIFFSVTSDGMTGPPCIKCFDDMGFGISNDARQLLQSNRFKPTTGITSVIAVLKGILFVDIDRIIKHIRTEAGKRHLSNPNPEVACLILKKFLSKEIEEMGLRRIITMHQPIKNNLLCVEGDMVNPYLGMHYDMPYFRCRKKDGFAFLLSQEKVSAQN